MQFVININTSISSEKKQEISNYLAWVSARVNRGEMEGPIIDIKGNVVGEYYENLCEVE